MERVFYTMSQRSRSLPIKQLFQGGLMPMEPVTEGENPHFLPAISVRDVETAGNTKELGSPSRSDRLRSSQF